MSEQEPDPESIPDEIRELALEEVAAGSRDHLEQKLYTRIEELEGVLRRIEEAKTPFSLDPLEHAHLCIETLREWAHDALDVKEPEHD